MKVRTAYQSPTFDELEFPILAHHDPLKDGNVQDRGPQPFQFLSLRQEERDLVGLSEENETKKCSKSIKLARNHLSLFYHNESFTKNIIYLRERKDKEFIAHKDALSKGY